MSLRHIERAVKSGATMAGVAGLVAAGMLLVRAQGGAQPSAAQGPGTDGPPAYSTQWPVPPPPAAASHGAKHNASPTPKATAGPKATNSRTTKTRAARHSAARDASVTSTVAPTASPGVAPTPSTATAPSTATTPTRPADPATTPSASGSLAWPTGAAPAGRAADLRQDPAPTTRPAATMSPNPPSAAPHDPGQGGGGGGPGSGHGDRHGPRWWAPKDGPGDPAPGDPQPPRAPAKGHSSDPVTGDSQPGEGPPTAHGQGNPGHGDGQGPGQGHDGGLPNLLQDLFGG